MEMAPSQSIVPLQTFPPSRPICVQHHNSLCLPSSSFKRAYGMVRRCEHFTEICLDDDELGNSRGAVVLDASEGMCRRFGPTELENWGNKRQGCCSSLVEKICHFNTIVVASLFTFGRRPSFFLLHLQIVVIYVSETSRLFNRSTCRLASPLKTGIC
jgi:hypothetical protein